MTQTIPLIQTADGFEMVRDAVANILTAEIASQQALAVEAELDPTPWDLGVYVERSLPWELFRDRGGEAQPVINVWYNTSNNEGQSSNNQTRQTMNSTINIDCLSSAVTVETEGGQVCGDEAGMLDAHRIARIVRRILMHPKWGQLGLESSKVVHNRWVGNRQAYKPSADDRVVEHVCGVQIQLTVRHNESVDMETLSDSEGALVAIKRDPDGAVIAQMDFDWT